MRGFWGGYVKDYLDASEPYFAVGEYWDSLSYTYGELDHSQDAHRQRIVDWINATSGTAGAFDVTTKGILHTVSPHLQDFFDKYALKGQKGARFYMYVQSVQNEKRETKDIHLDGVHML